MSKIKFVKQNPVKRLSTFQKLIIISLLFYRVRHFGRTLYRYNTHAKI